MAIKLSVDIGNGYSLVHDGRITRSLRSIYHTHHAGERALKNEMVVYRPELAPVVVGDDAKRFRSWQNLAEEDKTEAGIYFLLALLPEGRDKVFHLNVSVPDVNRYEAKVMQNLSGDYTFSVNDRPERTVSLQVMNVLQEGFGSYLTAKNGDRLAARGRTLVIDIGAGTYCASVIDNPTDEVLDVKTQERAGVLELCNAISSDRRLVSQLGENPDVGLLMDGIADQSFEYSHTDINFESYVREYSAQWRKGIISSVKSHFHNYIPSIKTILFTGGGALLLGTVPEGIIKIAASPLTDNVTGGFYA